MRIVIEGNIGSGKSTLLDQLHRALGPSVIVRPEPLDEWRDILPLFYEDPKTWGLPFSLHVLLNHHRNAAIPDGDLALVERSPLSCRHVFTKLLVNEQVISSHHWDLFVEYYDLIGWEPSARDLTLFVDTPVPVCLERIKARARSGENIDEIYLKKLEFAYETMIKFCAGPVVRLDGTLPPDELARRALDALKPLIDMPTGSLA